MPLNEGAPMSDSNVWFRVNRILETATALATVGACTVFMVVMLGPRLGTRTVVDPPGVGAAVPSVPISLAGAATDGGPGAKVAVIEYSDFQCPYCGKFARDTLPSLETRYVRPGKVLLAFKHLPLPIHRAAEGAARAAACAGEQGRFWEMHALLFGDQQHLDSPSLEQHAAVLGLPPEQFKACVSGQEVAQKISNDAAEARALGIRGTPTFFLGLLGPDRTVKVLARLNGSVPVEEFARELDRLISASN